MIQLASWLQGSWQKGQDPQTALYDPTHNTAIAEVSSRGLDLGAALAHARQVGGPALRALTFAQRGELLNQLAAAIHAAREPLLEVSRQNMGTTRSDAKFDIDGAAGTLAYYGNLGKTLGERRVLLDGEQVRFSRSARFVGQHILSPRHGVAIHINAFNFPAWNLCEKLAAALLAGMPVLAKPGTATALLSVRIVELWLDQGLLPAGALQLLVGSAGDLLDHVGPQDCIVFTGSGATGRAIRAHPQVIAHSVPVNVEADSLNACVLAPDVVEGSDLCNMALAEIVKEITQKAGQKCTAIRRILVPMALADAVAAELAARLGEVQIGDPAQDRTQLGPLAGPAQQRDVAAGVAELSRHAAAVYAGEAPAGGCFAAPRLFRSDAGLDAEFVHDHEVFGPVATLLPYDGSAAMAARLVARGGGSLVTSVYTDDADWAEAALLAMAPWSGRIYWASSKVFDQGSGHGAVMPSLVHGGPGKAGGGEELGGERGLRFYLQRTAIQGDTQLLRAMLA